MSPSPAQRIVIVGAGPCGLGCARELDRLGFADWVVAERDGHPGGKASSVVDPQGFTWDLGGHVVFSHYGEFDALLADVLGDDVLEHDRSSFIRLGDRWVPYPFQNNLRHLEPERTLECLLGLIDAPGSSPTVDFDTWMEGMFGEGITRHFMRPYNTKVWATPPEHMSATWIAERVSVVDHRSAVRNVVLGLDDIGWGPNNTFAFPRTGGTGEIYRRLADRLGGGRITYGRELVELDPEHLLLRFSDGSEEEADTVVSTAPIDVLVASLTSCPPEVCEAARRLRHNQVCIVGVGYEEPLHDDRSWLYFPEPETPFYRTTNFAKYSPANVPGGDIGRYSSYLTETSFAPEVEIPTAELEGRVVASLAANGLTGEDDRIASIHSVEIDYAYPVPTRDRDAALAVIQPWLEERRIFSRGRFGSWRYEIGNMDHAVKMGVDVARFLVEGRPEEIFRA